MLIRRMAGGCLALLVISSVIHANTDFIKQAIEHEGRSEKDRQRDFSSKPGEILSLTGIQPGDKVLDLFSGGGYYSEVLSYVVGSKGEVYAHNNDAYIKWVGEETIDRRYKGRLNNVKQLISETDDLKLPERYFDSVIMVMSYHDLYHVSDGWSKIDKDSLLAQINQSLKPGGSLLVIDHSAAMGTGRSLAQEKHRIEEAFVIKDLAKAGFKFKTSSDVLRNKKDDRKMNVFDKKIRGKTDRFVLVFTKN